MLVTTIGSQYWPITAEGRIHGLVLSIYSIPVFCYLTAALATVFVGRDAEAEHSGPASQQSVDALAQRLAAIEAMMRVASTAESSSPQQWEHRREPAREGTQSD